MSSQPAKPSPLSAEHAIFIQGGVAIDMATRDHRNIPRVARALCCRVSPDCRRVTLIVANRVMDRFIDALKGTRAIAAVFCLASTHRAIQLKGSDAVIEPIREDDVTLLEQTILKVTADWLLLGFSEAVTRTEMGYHRDELLAIAFTPDSVYEQTPGPKAGTPL